MNREHWFIWERGKDNNWKSQPECWKHKGPTRPPYPGSKTK